MEPTPTGGPPDPPGDRDRPGSDPAGGEPPGSRSGVPALPRRARSAGAAPDPQVPAPRTPPSRDPDGRPYGSSDDETLNRLLTGLRDI